MKIVLRTGASLGDGWWGLLLYSAYQENIVCVNFIPALENRVEPADQDTHCFWSLWWIQYRLSNAKYKAYHPNAQMGDGWLAKIKLNKR